MSLRHAGFALKVGNYNGFISLYYHFVQTYTRPKCNVFSKCKIAAIYTSRYNMPVFMYTLTTFRLPLPLARQKNKRQILRKAVKLLPL